MMLDLIKKHFPFETPNPGQIEAIFKILEQFRKGKKHVVLSSPTGTGKSIIATTVHRVLRELEPSFRTTIITSTKGLQDQYTSDDSEIFSLKGKKNYECPKGAGHYGTPQCKTLVMAEKCEKSIICPYFTTRQRWCNDAHLRITNSSFQIEASTGLVIEPEKRANLIVVDECHAIEEHLVSHSTLKLIHSELEHVQKVAGKEIISFLNEIINYFLDYEVGYVFTPDQELIALARKAAFACEAKAEQLEMQVKGMKGGKESILGGIEELNQITDKLRQFSSTSGDWIVTRFSYGSEVEFKPVHAFQVAEYGLFRKADQFLHMSATICGYKQYLKTLGIKEEDAIEISVDNPIPIESRPVVFIPKIRVSKDFDRGRLTELIDKVISRNGDENGIIHTVSFKLAEEIREHSEFSKRMLLSNDREQILSFIEKPKSGRIVVSPSVETGYDFKGDVARWQVIAKVPYLSLGDRWVEVNMKRDANWYARKAVLRVVQASGRIVRGVNDWGDTYIFDQNFEILLKKNRDLFPDWFLESIR